MNALLRRTGHFPHFWLLRHYHSWGMGQLLLMTTLLSYAGGSRHNAGFPHAGSQAQKHHLENSKMALALA